jgi:hypothetical protein
MWITYSKSKTRSRTPISAILIVSLGLVQGCGGGGSNGGGGGNTIQPPSNLTYPLSTITATVGAALSADTPTVTGTVDSYTVSPTFPSGLSLSSSTGAISGTPTAVAAQATYTVTAKNSGGPTTATVQIAVNAAVAAPSNLVYPQTTIAATVGTAITTDIPSTTGTVDSYTVSPTLPSGLSLSSSTGAISGTPTAVAASAIYVVTAKNSGGSTTAQVTIAVNKASTVLLELGHASAVQFLQFGNSRVLSQDDVGSSFTTHWVLWDYTSAAIVAQGDQGTISVGGLITRLPVDIEGNTVVIDMPNGLEVRSALDGHVLSTIASSSSWWKLASDGSFICAGSKHGLLVWAPTGQVLVSKSGDYSAAMSFAAPGEVRVALGPAGQNVIETISTATGNSSVGSTFSGQFNSWFVDGERFLTNVSNTVWVYSKTSVQEALVSLPTTENLTGQGNWVWTFNASLFPGYPLNIYAIGSSSPAATYNLTVDEKVIPSGMTIGALTFGSPSMSVIDLSGPSPAKADYNLPIAYTTAYAAVSGSQWLAANTHGVLLDGKTVSGTPRYFGLGKAWSIACSASRAAVATATGSILYFDPSGPTLQGTIGFSSSNVELSSDGAVLAAAANDTDAQYETDRTLKIFSLPTQTLTHAWSYSFQYQTPFLVAFSLSRSGTILGQVLLNLVNNGSAYSRQATATTGGSTIWSDMPPNQAPIQLSPDGTLVAVSGGPPDANSATNIYKNGVLVAAVPGWAVGWIDNSQLLVNSYTSGRQLVYAGSTIYDPTGAKVATPPLPELREFQVATSDWIYSAQQNTIYSLTTGAAVWTSPNPSAGIGAVSGSNIVFESGSRVLVESY